MVDCFYWGKTVMICLVMGGGDGIEGVFRERRVEIREISPLFIYGAAGVTQYHNHKRCIN